MMDDDGNNDNETTIFTILPWEYSFKQKIKQEKDTSTLFLNFFG